MITTATMTQDTFSDRENSYVFRLSRLLRYVSTQLTGYTELATTYRFGGKKFCVARAICGYVTRAYLAVQGYEAAAQSAADEDARTIDELVRDQEPVPGSLLSQRVSSPTPVPDDARILLVEPILPEAVSARLTKTMANRLGSKPLKAFIIERRGILLQTEAMSSVPDAAAAIDALGESDVDVDARSPKQGSHHGRH